MFSKCRLRDKSRADLPSAHLQSQTICNHRDKFRVRGLALYARYRIAEIRLQCLDVLAENSNFFLIFSIFFSQGLLGSTTRVYCNTILLLDCNATSTNNIVYRFIFQTRNQFNNYTRIYKVKLHHFCKVSLACKNWYALYLFVPLLPLQ